MNLLTAVAVVIALSGNPVMEDSPGWDCRYDGNRICGVGNAQGVLPGDYSNDNCWPGAIYCPPAGAPEDTTVTR